eukprot:16173-Rhodomonas_salina.3
MEVADMESAAADKDNQYLDLLLFLTGSYPTHQVQCLSLVMSVFGTLPQRQWTELYVESSTVLGDGLGLTEAQFKMVQVQALRECILAGHALHNTYHSLLEATRWGVVWSWRTCSSTTDG